jgi:GR25 family glycosyltransferase involved in LPS biosynthesis
LLGRHSNHLNHSSQPLSFHSIKQCLPDYQWAHSGEKDWVINNISHKKFLQSKPAKVTLTVQRFALLKILHSRDCFWRQSLS